MRLLTFGGLVLAGSPAQSPKDSQPAQRRSLTLLAILATHRGPMPRDRIIAILWGESDAHSARTALRQAVFAAKRDVSSNSIIAGTDTLALNAGVLASDVGDFLSAAEKGDHASVVQLYTGPFLDSVYSRGSVGLDNWIATQRSRFAAIHRTAIHQLAQLASESGNQLEAVSWWKRLVEEEPLSSLAARGLMESHIAAGDSGAALEHYQNHRRVIQKELGSAPDPSLEELAKRIKLSSAQGRDSIELRHDRETVAGEHNHNFRGAISVRPTRQQTEWRFRPKWLLATMAIAGVAFFAVTMVISLAGKRSDRSINASEGVAVAPFENRTDDPRFEHVGTMAADWIIDGLARSGLVNVVDPATAFFAARDAREGTSMRGGNTGFIASIARATGASTVITGDYYLKGDSLEFHARVADGRSERVSTSIAPVVVSSLSPIDGLQQVRQRILGAFARSVDARLSDIVDSMSVAPGFDAYQAYVKGLEDFMRGDYAAAAPSFRNAFVRDSTFAAALLWASHAYYNNGDVDSAKAVLEELVPLRSRLVPLDRYGLDALRTNYAGDIDSSITIAKKAAALAPRSQWVWNVAEWSMYDNRPRQAIAYLKSIDPSRGWWKAWEPYWVTLAQAQHIEGEYAAEAQTIEAGLKLQPGNLELAEVVKARNLIARGDVPGALDIARKMIRERAPQMTQWIAWTIFELRMHGHQPQADSLFALIPPWYQSQGHATPGGRWGYGRILFRAQRWTELRLHYKSIADEFSFNPVTFGYIGAAAASLGDTAEAVAMSDTLKRFTEPGIRGTALFWRAHIAARLGKRAECVEFLREAMATGEIRSPGPGHRAEDRFPNMQGYPPFDEMMRIDR